MCKLVDFPLGLLERKIATINFHIDSTCLRMLSDSDFFQFNAINAGRSQIARKIPPNCKETELGNKLAVVLWSLPNINQ